MIKRPRAFRFWLCMFVLTSMMMLTGCDTTWTSQASSIIALIGPALSAVMALLAAFGVGLDPNVMQVIMAAKDEAVNTLTNVVKPLLDDYEKAQSESEKQDILTKIDLAIHDVQNKLADILASLHIKDPAVQQKAAAAVVAVDGLIESLIALIPVLKATGKVSLAEAHDAGVLTPDQFKRVFNRIMTAKTGNTALDSATHEFTI